MDQSAAEEVWQERMDEMSEEEMEQAFPHMMLQMMGEMETMIGDLGPGETRPQAEVRSPPEGEMWVWIAGHVELLRILEHVRVAEAGQCLAYLTHFGSG